ncbi:TPA: lytic murein transglycosylase, partial [Mannheimia haemolytica]|nr:lytic murein transglycosylase [Mannheimia haemolytica]
LIRPDKEAGRAFLVSNNFRTLMDWNKSNNFGISIGKFADRILASVGQ